MSKSEQGLDSGRGGGPRRGPEPRPESQGGGTRRYSAQKRAALLEEFERSGLSQAEFCRRQGMTANTLMAW